VKLSSEPIVTNQIEWHPYLDEEIGARPPAQKHGIAGDGPTVQIARGRAVGDEVLTAQSARKYGKSCRARWSLHLA
jgi:diketogulonate reductase-like aldo/keto reductase